MTHPSSATTTIIHRPSGGLTGYRRVADRASRAVVHGFPLSDLAAVAAAGLLTGAGAYVLTDGLTAYFGESGRPAHRLAKHACDPAKGFARDVFVVGGESGLFDKLLAVDFQYRLTHLALEAGVVAVVKGTGPAEPRLTDDDRATHDRIYGDALRLLHDAGCTIFTPAQPTVSDADETPPEPTEPPAAEEGEDGTMTIGISTSPPGAEEFELRYLGLWARAYRAGGSFVVAAGSELRDQTNDSADVWTRKRRDELRASGVLAAIPGVNDRRRLVAAVEFASASIAAKVLCGAHTPGRWQALNATKAVWRAA